MATIKVISIAGEHALDPDQGQIVYEQIKARLDQGQKVVLDFAGVKTIISAFLNPAIGQLFGHYDDDTLKDRLDVINLTPDDMALLGVVIRGAKKFYRERDGEADS